MGGSPCKLKGILDSGVAANRGFECMRNTANIVASVTAGKVELSRGAEDAFLATAEAYGRACLDVEAELSPYLPPDEPSE